MKSLLIATHNRAKIKEIILGTKVLRKSSIKIITLSDLKLKNQPKETGKTFMENALLKAKFYGDLTHLPTISDDAGLIIPFLNNGPGVKSKRWLGYEATDEQLINYVLKRLQGIAKSQRKAYLQTCVCFYDPKTKISFCETEKIDGHIAEKPNNKIVKGFPYRALLIVKKFNKYYDKLTDQEHKQVNHRLKAIKKLSQKINKFLLK